MSYKVDDSFTAVYSSPTEPRYTIGQRVQIKDGNKLLAIFVVEANDGDRVHGKIVNTYGYGRRKRVN